MIKKKISTLYQKGQYPSFRSRIFIVLFMIFFVFILGISYITYSHSISQIETDFSGSRLQTEKTFVSSALLTEFGLESFDAKYDYLLHERALQFSKEYQDHQHNPSLIPLQQLKTRISSGINGDIELFIINKSGVIEYTTYPDDLGVDFSRYPDFFSSLTRIRLGNEFRSDPWIQDFYNPAVYWKYGYLPTRDHQYLLEIGLRNGNYSSQHTEMVADLKKLTGQALNISDLLYVEIYDKTLRKRTIRADEREQNLSLMTGLFTGNELGDLLNRTFETKQSSVIPNPHRKQVISVQYVDLSPTRSVSGSERSFIGILVFSTESREKTIVLYRIGFVAATILALIICLVITRYLSASISKPIEMMTQDVEIIASSNLHHSVRSTGICETEKLRVGINKMIDSIKSHIGKIESQNYEIKNELVLRRRAESSLSRANKRLLQLSQITRHDILNQVTALHLSLELASSEKEISQFSLYSEKAQSILRVIADLLYFTYDYEKIGQQGSIWQNLGELLDQNREEFSGQINLIHSCNTVEIKVDPLFRKVIYNLIDNTIRHGTKADTVRVIFSEDAGKGKLIYQDNGVGIVESDKKKIFDHAFGKGTGLGLAFIREVLESDEVMIAETGISGEGATFEMIFPQDRYRFLQ
jgi:signal transduction histidine kinase